MEDGADGNRRLVRGRRHGVLGLDDGRRRGASDGVWRRDVLVGRPLTELRGAEQAGRLMLVPSMTLGESMAKGKSK